MTDQKHNRNPDRKSQKERMALDGTEKKNTGIKASTLRMRMMI